MYLGMSVVRAAGLLVYRVVNGSFEYLLLQASYPPHHWTPPKGHVDPGEDEWTAALRETKEEASIGEELLDIHKDFKHVQSYEAHGKAKTVCYWLARLKTYDIKLSHEHQKWQWLTLEPAIELVNYPEMAEMLRKAENYLKSKQD